jgi:hypothetical protein
MSAFSIHSPPFRKNEKLRNQSGGERTMKKTIVAIAAAAFFATGMFAVAPALAAGAKQTTPQMHPLPAIGVLPAMWILETKRNPKFKPVKPYGPKTRTSL